MSGGVQCYVAGDVPVVRLAAALAHAGLIVRHDARSGAIVIEPVRLRPLTPADAEDGIAWWNQLAPARRAYWLAAARSAVPADAWEAYKRGG